MARRKGSGSIRRMGRSYYIRFQQGGKEKLIKLNASNAEEAKAEAAKYNVIAEARTTEELAMFVGRAKKLIENNTAIPLQNAFLIFEKSPKRPECGRQQLQAHKYYFNEFLNALPPNITKISDISATLAEKYFTDLQTKPRSYNARLKTLRLIFRVLGMEQNPFREIKLKQEMPKSKKYFSLAQRDQIFNAVDSAYPLSIPHRNEMKILIRLLAYTGMRLKDCCLFEAQYINFDTDMISVVTQKTRRYAIRANIPLHPHLKALLVNLPCQGYLMPNIADRYKRNPSGVDQSVCRIIDFTLATGNKTYIGRNGAVCQCLPEHNPDYGAHSFRHSFISWLANEGIPLDVIKDIVGQNNVNVTRIYAHYSDETKRKILKALPGSAYKTDRDQLTEAKTLIRKMRRLILPNKTLRIARLTSR